MICPHNIWYIIMFWVLVVWINGHYCSFQIRVCRIDGGPVNIWKLSLKTASIQYLIIVVLVALPSLFLQKFNLLQLLFNLFSFSILSIHGSLLYIIGNWIFIILAICHLQVTLLLLFAIFFMFAICHLHHCCFYATFIIIMSRGESMGTPSRVNNYFIFLFLVERYFNKNKFHDISPGL